MRNKGRFFAVVLGMTAAVALTLFALGFNNSFRHLINNHYEQVIKYDLSVNIQTAPLEKDFDIVSLPGVEEYSELFTFISASYCDFCFYYASEYQGNKPP